MSGNSTGGRVTRDDEEPVPTGRGLWAGEVTGLRLGDVPEEDDRRTGTEQHKDKCNIRIEKCSNCGTYQW